jgi:hypothetical protein
VETYDGLTREQIRAVLDFAARSLQAPALARWMLILFDQATPVPIRRYLSGHTVKTAAEQGWSQMLNGEWLRVAEVSGFNVLLPPDQGIRHQQNLRDRRIAIVILGSAQWPLIKPIVEQVASAVKTC